MLIIFRLKKKEKTTNITLANQAIKKGFDQLVRRILLKEDIVKLTDLKFSSIKQLVTYYQISDVPDEEKMENLQILALRLIKIKYMIFFIIKEFHILKYQKRNYIFYQY